MSRHIITIKSKRYLNHNVIEFVTTKPKNYSFKPGQATDVAIPKSEWEDEKRPFTFTSLPTDDFLQFTIKIYPSHDGVTKQLAQLKVGDNLSVGEVYGAIQYKNKGVFLAGGAGITPFLAILKKLDVDQSLQGNSLIFANKTEADIFLESTLESMLGTNYTNVLSQENNTSYMKGHIDKALLKEKISDWSQHFYVCGPPEMIEAVISDLKSLGVDHNQIVKEDFED